MAIHWRYDMTTRKRLIPILMACLFCAGLALALPLEREPGYVDLEWIDIPDDADEIQDIDLSYMLDDLAMEAREDGEKGLAEAIAMIRSIRVKSFSVDRHDSRTENAVDKINSELRESGWNRMIYIKNEDQNISVNTMHDDGQMVGLMVVVFEPGESAAFINVVGDLDIGKLIQLAGEYDLDDLDEFVEEHEGHHAY